MQEYFVNKTVYRSLLMRRMLTVLWSIIHIIIIVNRSPRPYCTVYYFDFITLLLFILFQFFNFYYRSQCLQDNIVRVSVQMVLENSMKIITSERGKELALFNSCKYRFVRQRRDGQIKWLCTNKKCYASILSDSQRSAVLLVLGEHNHVIDPMEKIQRQFLRENCKQKASRILLFSPLEIIECELTKTDYKIQHKDILSIQKAMYDKRRKDCPNDLSMKQNSWNIIPPPINLDKCRIIA